MICGGSDCVWWRKGPLLVSSAWQWRWASKRLIHDAHSCSMGCARLGYCQRRHQGALGVDFRQHYALAGVAGIREFDSCMILDGYRSSQYLL